MAIKTVKFTLNGQTVELSYDSTNAVYSGTVTAPGTTSWNQNDDHKYNGTVAVEDTAGNKVTATVSDFSTLGLRVLEKTKPTISVTYPTAGAYVTNSKPTIKWTVTDADSGINSDTISIKIDGGTAVTSGITKTAATNGYTCEYTPSTALSEGSHTFTFNVSDNDGNAATATSVSCTIDTVPPTLNISAPANNAITNNATVTVSGTTNDTTSSPVSLTVKVGSGTAKTVSVNSDGSFSTTVTIVEGANTITIVSKDSAGKTTTVTRTVTLDTSIPVIQSITLTPNPVDAGATYVVTVKVTD
jgi:hypothetical protein